MMNVHLLLENGLDFFVSIQDANSIMVFQIENNSSHAMWQGISCVNVFPKFSVMEWANNCILGC
jgi:hypothetical protein